MDITPDAHHPAVVPLSNASNSQRYNPGALRVLVAVVILTIIGNLIFLTIIGQNALPLLESR